MPTFNSIVFGYFLSAVYLLTEQKITSNYLLLAKLTGKMTKSIKNTYNNKLVKQNNHKYREKKQKRIRNKIN
jgi:hypothetical protein